MTGPIFICGGGPVTPDVTSACPDRDRHTPAPTGYVDQAEWAARMYARGFQQRRCPGCGLWKVWVAQRREVAWP